MSNDEPKGKKEKTEFIKRFTQLFVDRVTPPKTGRVDYLDTVLPGFRLRVSDGGHKSYSIVTRLNGTQRRFTIGTAATYKVDEARDAARRMLQDIDRGVDPTIKPEAPKTVREVAEAFILSKSDQRAWKVTRGLLKNHILPPWGNKDVKAVSKSDARQLMNKLKAANPGMGANNAFSAVRQLFNYARAQDLIERSPFEDVKAPSPKTERDRVLTDADLARVVRAAEALDTFPRVFVKAMILTAQRRTEVSSMRWADVDLTNAVWTIPRKDTKGDRTHQVPLTPAVVTLLEALPRMNSAFVFPGRRRIMKDGLSKDVSIAHHDKIKKALDKALTKDGGPEIERFTFHDFRRTASTIMARLKVLRLTVSLVLNHAEGGVTKIYDRYAYLDEKRAALEKLANHVDRIVNPNAERDNIVRLASSR